MARKRPVDFDTWLAAELDGGLGRASGPTPHPAHARYHAEFLEGARRRGVRRGLKRFVATPAAVAMVTVLAGGAVGAFAAAGAPTSGDWGAKVTQAVTTCKAGLTTGHHGIGDCVSAVASQKGQQERAAHSASANGTNGTGAANASSTGQANGKPGQHGKSESHPNASDHPGSATPSASPHDNGRHNDQTPNPHASNRP